MIPASSSPPSRLSTHDSCCIKIRKCLCDKKTTQSAKIAFWFIGAMAAIWVPVPFVNGLLTGSMLFMSGHEMAQHPDAPCIRRAFSPHAQNRTWKHISAGAAISGIGWGLGTLALTSKIPLLASFGLGVGVLGGTALGFKIAYSNLVFAAGPPRSDEGQPLVEVVPGNGQNSHVEER